MTEQRQTLRDENLNEWFASLRDISSDVEGVRAAVMTLRTELLKHIAKEDDFFENHHMAMLQVGKLVKAFPYVDGEPDLATHHDDHKYVAKQRKTAEEQEEDERKATFIRKQKVKDELYLWGSRGAIGLAVFSVLGDKAWPVLMKLLGL